MANKIPIITETTAVPLQVVYRVVSFLFIAAPAIWWAASQTQKLDVVVELVKDVPQIKQDIAVIKVQQEHLAEQEKNSLGAETIGGDSAPVPLASPAKPAWSYSVPKGWTLGPDGKLRKL